MAGECIFCRIIRGEIPAKKLYEDDELVAFWDISPQAPTHFLVIPKKHLSGPAGATADDDALIGRLLRQGAALATANGAPEFRLVLNSGLEAGQTVFHLHLHVLGGRPMAWPPG